MKKSIKRILSLLMSCAMAASMLGTVAFAEETAPDYEAENIYVLNYENTSVEGYEDWCKPRFYFSPYRTDIYVDGHVDGEDTGEGGWWGWCTSSVYNMINTTKIDPTIDADKPYASIKAFCVDAMISGAGGHDYSRVNLEDSTYFDDTVAGRIRAIIMNSLYAMDNDTLDDVVAAANVWAKANGRDPIVNLNKYEMISAAQSTIWTITNNGFLADDAYAGYCGYTGYPYKYTTDWYDANCFYNDIPNYRETENTRNNINTLARYYESLEPMDPQGTLISAASFEDAQVTYTEAEDGTLTATVKATVTAEVQGDTALTLTAVCEGKSAATQTVKNGTHIYTMTIEGLSAVTEISLAIDGIQENGDVYLFAPLNGRKASQTMAGYDESALPVHAETKIVENERILNIRKIGKLETKDAEGNITYETINLANIVFDVYFVGTLEDYLDGKVEILDEPTAEDAVKQVASLKTDENGEASLNLTRKGLEDGVYLVIEKQSAATTAESLTKPFYVLLPYTSDSGNTWEYVVNAQPKNTLIGGPEIVKDVTRLGNDHDTFAVNEDHTWIISADIPADIADGIKYEISDTLNTRLDYVGNVKVTAETEVPVAEKTVDLVADTDYILTETKNETDDTRVDKFTVALTAAGMDKVAKAVDANKVDTIRVYFDTKINDTAEMDAEIPNQATLQYTNSTNYTYDAESDKPEVHTGGFNLVKVDGASKSEVEGVVTYANKLSGAEFKLYRDATEAEIAAKDTDKATVEVEAITLENGDVKKVVCITTLTSDTNGAASYNGLAYGTYYLVETKAPVTEKSTYNLLLHPVVVTVEKGSYLEESALTVENFSGFELPETGGIGTTIYTAMGTLMICAAGAYIILSKKRVVC